VGFAVLRADDRPIADNHRQRRPNLTSDWKGKVISPASYERYLNASPRSGRDSGAVGLWELPAAVQKRAVNIQGDQPNAHSSIIPLK
jgi:hypothetical protein